MDIAQDEVLEELARTSIAEAKSAGFTRAKIVFFGVLNAKIDLLNLAQDTEKGFGEELQVEQERRQADVVSLENEVGRLQAENTQLRVRLVKADTQIAKFKDGLQKFTKRAITKFIEGFCLACM